MLASIVWFWPSILSTKSFATGDALASKIMYIGSSSTLVMFRVFRIIVKPLYFFKIRI